MRWLAVLIALVALASARAESIAFTHVTVVDVAAGVLRADQAVVIDGNRIVAADAASRVRVPAGARVIRGQGCYLIPGLWDMHVHEFTEAHVPELFLANGVTGVRDMYDRPNLRDVRREIEEHRRPGPRLVADGLILNYKMTPEEAREAVRRQVRAGMDFVKVSNALPRDAYYAVADEAKRAGIPFVGHTPDAITTLEAAAAGQRSIEHLDGVLLDCSPLGKWLRHYQRFEPDQRLLDSFEAARAHRVFAAYARHGTWHCPTLMIYRAAPLDDPAFRYLPGWRPRPGTATRKDAPLDRAIGRKMMEVTAMMFRDGVRLLAGTDTGVPYVLPGFGLHDELELMAAAGIPAAGVLRIATLAPAQFLGRENDLGDVARGKVADLVLLDADPLASIANTRQVRAVVADGRLFDRAALDRLLADAR